MGGLGLQPGAGTTNATKYRDVQCPDSVVHITTVSQSQPVCGPTIGSMEVQAGEGPKTTFMTDLGSRHVASRSLGASRVSADPTFSRCLPGGSEEGRISKSTASVSSVRSSMTRSLKAFRYRSHPDAERHRKFRRPWRGCRP